MSDINAHLETWIAAARVFCQGVKIPEDFLAFAEKTAKMDYPVSRNSVADEGNYPIATILDTIKATIATLGITESPTIVELAFFANQEFFTSSTATLEMTVDRFLETASKRNLIKRRDAAELTKNIRGTIKNRRAALGSLVPAKLDC